MADAEAKALIHAADKDGNQGIDFNEFAKFWETLHGESDVSENIETSLGNVDLCFRPSGRSSPRLMRTRVATSQKVELGVKYSVILMPILSGTKNPILPINI